MEAPLSSKQAPNDYTHELWGSAVPSLMLYAARHQGPAAFEAISLDQCSFSLDGDPEAMAVVLCVRASASNTESEGSDSQIEFRARVPLLPTDGPGLIGDQSLSAQQIALLQGLAGLSLPAPVPRQPLRELQVEEVSGSDLSCLTSQLGKFAVTGTTVSESGERFYLDYFFFDGSHKLAVNAVDFYGDDAKVRAPRSAFEVAGYLLSSSFLETPVVLAGWHREMAKSLFELVLGHLEDFGNDLTANELNRIVDFVGEDLSHAVGRPEPRDSLVLHFDSAPAELSLDNLRESYRRPGRVDFQGIAIPSNPSVPAPAAHYVDLKTWRASQSTSKRKLRPLLTDRDSVILRAVDTSQTRVFLPPTTPDKTTGYVIQIGPDRGGAYFPGIDRAVACEVFDSVVKTYRSRGLRAALKKAWEFENNL